MIRTPNQNDEQVEKTVCMLRDEFGVVSAATLLNPPKCSRKTEHTYYSLSKLYGDSMAIGTGFGLVYNYKKASTMVLYALLCTVLGRAPSTIYEFLAVRGIGLKCAHVCMYEGHGVVTGIPVDIHMWRMFCHLGWTSDMDEYNVDKSTREIESWFPREYWGEMNELYAGLGQLLQSGKHRSVVAEKVRALAKKTNNKEVVQMAETLLSIPEYNK